jgi:hypothetical protein
LTNPVAPASTSGSTPASTVVASLSRSADALQVKTQDNAATLTTVLRSGDESATTQDRGDHGSIAAGLAANGDGTVAGKLDARSTEPGTLAPHDDAIQPAGGEDQSQSGDHPLDRKLAGVGSAALEAARDRRVEMDALHFRGADALASCSPYEPGVLERAVDRFLEQLGGSDTTALPGLLHRSNVIPGVVVAAVALTAVETMRRRSGNDRDQSGGGPRAEEDEHSAGFPGLPARRRFWALEER